MMLLYIHIHRGNTGYIAFVIMVHRFVFRIVIVPEALAPTVYLHAAPLTVLFVNMLHLMIISYFPTTKALFLSFSSLILLFFDRISVTSLVPCLFFFSLNGLSLRSYLPTCLHWLTLLLRASSACSVTSLILSVIQILFIGSWCTSFFPCSVLFSL